LYTEIDMPWGAAIGAIGAIGSAAISEGGQEDPQMAPPAFSQLPPHLQNLNQEQYNLAMTQYGTPFQGFGGQRYAPMNGMQNQAMGMVQNRAGGSPTEMAAQGAVQRGASGNANPMFGMDNPYTTKAIDATTSDMQRQFDRTTRPMLDAMNSRAATGFGTNSGVDEMRNVAYQGLNDQMGQVSNDMRMKDLFAQQQMGEGMAQRQLQAANLAPSMQGMDYNNANQLMNAGNFQQARGDQQGAFDYGEFMRQLQYPGQQMNLMGQAFGGVTGGATMMPAQQSPNYFNQALGGAMAGQGVYNMFNQPQQQMVPGASNSLWDAGYFGGSGTEF
jgi:hypothetical protein